MTKYQFQKKILLRSIFIMLILFIILTVVFSGYVIKTQTIEFEDQVDTQLQGITSQIDNTLQLADDIALQIAANFQIIDVFNKLQGYHGHREFFEVEEDIQCILENYYTKEEILKEFDFLLKDIFGIEVYDSRDKKIIALKMKNYLDEKFRSNVTNQLLAANFGFVPSYLVSIFKICYGLTPMDYLVNKRIDEAKVLLEDGSLKIKDIARVVGYEDSLYFSKVFKKFTGVSPKEYKGDGV